MIEIIVNKDSTIFKQILYNGVKYCVESSGFIVESLRGRRNRDSIKHVVHWVLPEGISKILYKDTDFSVEVYSRGDPVGTECGAKLYVELKIIIDETKYPNYKEILNDFFNDSYTFYKEGILDQNEEPNKVTCFMWDDYWDDIYKRKKRPFRTVHLNKEQSGMFDDVKTFISPDTEKLYENYGVPYKRNYLFEGYPGTGKTSLIFSIASELNMNVAILSFKPDMDDVKFTRALLRIPPNCILVLEDIDVLFNENRKKNDVNKNMITLSGLLNILDGLAHQEKQIIIMTTNYKCTLDNALQRPGRIDKIVHFDFANKSQIQAMYNKFLPKQVDKFEEFYKQIKHLDITTATLQQFLFQNIYEENIMERIDELKELVGQIDYTNKKLYLYT
jgi:hypothetical protein